MCGATSHVRFTPNSDRESGFPRLPSDFAALRLMTGEQNKIKDNMK
jgi:hypothetical protein